MEENKKKNFLKLGIIEICIFIVIGIVLFAALSYFKVIPFKLPFVPTSKPQLSTDSSRPSVAQIETAGYGCIFDGRLCSQGEKITAPSQGNLAAFYGLGFSSVPSGTPIKAAISGTMGVGFEKDPTTNQNINIVTIKNAALKEEANYMYAGDPPDQENVLFGTVKKGDVIGETGSGSVTFRQDPKKYNLIFFLFDTSKKVMKQVEPSDLK